ncbi:MAG: glycyl-radical enzyme activating protein [Smithellaceae bacterium]
MTDDQKGLIFNIQKFSVHDGPGIRTTVFLKGCPLKCAWCSNPESQNFFPELLVRDMNCTRCGACVAACPRGAIRITGKHGRIIDRQKCDQCLLCVQSCLYDALRACGTCMTVQETVAEVMQDRLFYENSGGGVTLSGGEPLSQMAFTETLLEACKKEGLHTALETSGAAPWSDMERVLRFVDLLLFDIKHLDSNQHEKMTGVHNFRILENLRQSAAQSVLWLRVPLISGFNDSESHIKKIAFLGADVGAQKISLLPYHEGGKTKSRQMGKVYAYPEGKAPGEKHIGKLKRIIERAGLAVSVGN